MLIKVITKMNVYEVKQVVSTCMNKCFTLSLFYLLKVLDLLNSTSQKKSLIPKQRMWWLLRQYRSVTWMWQKQPVTAWLHFQAGDIQKKVSPMATSRGSCQTLFLGQKLKGAARNLNLSKIFLRLQASATVSLNSSPCSSCQVSVMRGRLICGNSPIRLTTSKSSPSCSRK